MPTALRICGPSLFTSSGSKRAIRADRWSEQSTGFFSHRLHPVLHTSSGDGALFVRASALSSCPLQAFRIQMRASLSDGSGRCREQMVSSKDRSRVRVESAVGGLSIFWVKRFLTDNVSRNVVYARCC